MGLQALAIPPAVTVQEIARTQTTAVGQRIELPAIPPGASLPVHEHRFPRYAYVLSGPPGAFIVEMVDTWHRGSNSGEEPARLLVIDQVEPGTSNTILREP